MCVILGNGFANAIDFDIWQFESSPFRRAPCFALTLTYNGKQTLQTDISFELYDSAIMFDDIRAGERYDARLRRTELFAPSSKALPGCKKPIIVETPHGELRKCNVEPIREQRRFSAQRVISSRDGYIYDFGENNAGVVCLRVNGESGQKITFDFGEVVIDGKLNKDNIVCDFACDDYKWDYVQHDEYICTDGWQTWTPSFTYHGFRYVYVTGLTSEQATIDALQCIVLHSDVKQRGNFRCSNQTLNRIYDITLRSDLSNLFYLPTDCPQREKNGWTADAALSAEQFLYNFDCGKTLAEWLVNVCKAQRSDGMMPGIVPTCGWGYQWGNGPAWDCVITEIPYQLCRFYGDTSVIENALPTILRYFDFISTVINADGLVDFGLGDWCEAEAEQCHDYSTPVQYTNALTLLDMANKTLRMLDVLQGDYITQRAKMEEEKQRFTQSFRNNYVKAGRITVQTQTALAMAITSGVLTADEKKQAHIDLAGLLKARNYRFRVGVIGAKHLFDALTMFGDTDVAIRTIVGPDYPSYGYMLANGATTLWESFYKLRADGAMWRSNGQKVDSLNHHFWGSVVSWFYRVVGGLDVRSVNEVLVTVPQTQLVTNAEISYTCGDKHITVVWQRNEAKGTLTIFGNNYALKDVIDGNVTVENDQDFTNDDYKRAFDKKVFFGFAALQQSEFFTSMSEWNGNLWHIDVDEGKIDFGVKEYVEPEFRYETINVQESDRVRAELDINNNGTLNNGKIIHIDIADIIDTSDYTLVSVNGNGAASNNVTADLFGYLYGNQTVQLVVDAEDTRYTINLPMLLISKVIRTCLLYTSPSPRD